MKANPIKVLLFEDNPGDIRLLQEFLRVDNNDPYELIIEGNLRKGLLRLHKEKPDVILLDLGLPDSLGMDTFSKVHSQTADVPIVILTGLAETEIAVEAVKAGAQDYLVKGEVNDSLLRRSLRYAIERKRGEEQLRESEKRYHLVFENSGTANTIFDKECRVILQNSLSQKLTTSIDALGKTALEIFGPGQGAIVSEHIRHVLSSGISEVFETKFDMPAGSKWMRSSYFPLYQHRDELVGIQVISQDITEQKHADEALRESEESFHSLVENAPIGIYRTTPDGRITMVNPALLRVLGYKSFDELVQRDLSKEGYEPEYPRHDFQELMKQKGEIVGLESAWKRKDGSTIFVRESARLVRDENHQPHYYEGTVENITERKQAEDKLNEERILLRTLIDNLPDRIYVKDVQGRKILSNTADWQASGGKTMEDIIGKTDLDIYPPELAVQYWAIDKAVIESGLPVINREEPGLDSQRKPVWVLSSKVPLRASQGKIVGLVGIGHDITEQKKIEEKIEILSRIPDESPNPILRVSKQGNLLYANKSSAPLLAVWKTQGGQILSDEWQKKVKNVFDSGLYQEVEVQAGEMFYSLILAPIIDQGYVNMYGRDITLRKRAEETLVQRNEEIQKRNLELDRLYQATGSLLSSTPYNLKGLATTIVDTVLNQFGHANCSLIVVRKDSNELVCLATGGPYTDQVKDKKLTLDDPGLVSQAITAGKLMNTGDIHTIPGFLPNWNEVQSELTIPLTIEDDVIGVIDIQSSVQGAFSPGDERLMSIFAERAALALERGRLNEELENHVHQLTALRTIDMAISSSMDIRLTLDILLENLIQNLGIHAADVLIYDPITQTFRFYAGRGFHTQALQHTDLRMGDGYAGQAALSRKIVSIKDLHRNTGGLQRSLEFRNEGFISYMGAPLIAKGQVKGVLEIFQRDAYQLNSEQVAFLEMLAGQAAIAIDSSQLFENLQSSNSDLILAYDETIEGWSRAVDLRDEETEGHSQRVTDMTLRMANKMGLKPEELLHVRRGALLHDIGKIGIPDSILLKPGPLTDEEWVIMRKHPQLAHDMLKPIAYLGTAIEIPWCHHEKWDGTGYPRGLKGEDIPLAARIFAVVDVWDALLSNRPYRKAWPVDKARTYIQEQAGKYFDPHAVDMFLKLITNIP